MLPEQEQRILGYFIEEARDHLNTIEQGLLNLHNIISDPEMVNELFRAAHSVKGGAAMLGLHSIQQTAHRLEDCFKVFQECPQIQVDQKLESLFLRVFDTLKELLDQLEGSFGISEDVANQLMSEVEPVFAALKAHLGQLKKAGEEGRESGFDPSSLASKSPVFQNDVLQQLRQMLQLFKQAETAQSRQQLQECCQKLLRFGEQFDLPSWCTLCQTAMAAIANSANSYRTLAPIVIKEIKQSQELVLAGRGAEITTSSQLRVLCAGSFASSPKDTSIPNKGL